MKWALKHKLCRAGHVTSTLRQRVRASVTYLKTHNVEFLVLQQSCHSRAGAELNIYSSQLGGWRKTSVENLKHISYSTAVILQFWVAIYGRSWSRSRSRKYGQRWSRSRKKIISAPQHCLKITWGGWLWLDAGLRLLTWCAAASPRGGGGAVQHAAAAATARLPGWGGGGVAGGGAVWAAWAVGGGGGGGGEALCVHQDSVRSYVCVRRSCSVCEIKCSAVWMTEPDAL